MELENFVLGAFDFIGNLDFNMFSFVLGFLFIIFWLVIVGWVWVDSGERTSKNSIRFVYILIVAILNIPGLIIYLIIRPSETIEEIYWADLERRYLKFETAELGDCSKCGHQLLPGYVFCTNCGNEIKVRCPKCNVFVDKDHKHCEFCGFQIRDRAVQQEKYPDVAVMEQQIIATKEHATETVESKRTRYKTGNSFVVKLGDAIIAPFVKIKEKKEEQSKVDNSKKESGNTVENTKTENQSNRKKKDKKKKKRK